MERGRKEIFPIGALFQADRRALPQRTIEDVAQVEEPGERGGAPGARGGMALIVWRAPPSRFCPNGKPDEGDDSHAENDNRNRGHFDDG